MKIIEISELLGGRIEGDSGIEISGVAKIENAVKSEITFIANPLYEKYFDTTNAGAVIVSDIFKVKNVRKDLTIIRVKDPYLSFLNLVEKFNSGSGDIQTGISEFSFIESGCELGENIYLGSFTSIGKKCKIGSGTKIYPNTAISSDVSIGINCTIYSNVIIYKGCRIGNNVIIHSGTIIGSDGFGFARQDDGKYKKIPQTGIVKIEDNVEIGANCCIDRATIGETKICKGVKLDNQIQVAHNVEIGEDTVIAAQVGIAGSTKIGKRCMIGGQSGLVGHINICDDVIIGASVGVSKSIDKAGIYIGYRAKPQRESLMTDVRIKNLGDLEKRIKELEKKLS